MGGEGWGGGAVMGELERWKYSDSEICDRRWVWEGRDRGSSAKIRQRGGGDEKTTRSDGRLELGSKLSEVI